MIITTKKSYFVFGLILFAVIGDFTFGWSVNLRDHIERYIQKSHVSENVPENVSFESYLKRDLQAFFKNHFNRDDIVIESDLLRKGATQSGVAYPKFYSWIKILDSSGKIVERGATRIAAVEKDHFEVTHFFEASKIISDPESVRSVFPKALLEKIQDLAQSEN